MNIYQMLELWQLTPFNSGRVSSKLGINPVRRNRLKYVQSKLEKRTEAIFLAYNCAKLSH